MSLLNRFRKRKEPAVPTLMGFPTRADLAHHYESDIQWIRKQGFRIPYEGMMRAEEIYLPFLIVQNEKQREQKEFNASIYTVANEWVTAFTGRFDATGIDLTEVPSEPFLGITIPRPLDRILGTGTGDGKYQATYIRPERRRTIPAQSGERITESGLYIPYHEPAIEHVTPEQAVALYIQRRE